MKKRILNAVSALSIILLNTIAPVPSFAKLSNQYLDMFSQNNILFYDPTGPKNYCTSEGDCYISGNTRDEKLWSALRHVGFTPEQAAGIIGNIVHEGGSPTRQEEAYNIARDRNCTTQDGKQYSIYLDSTDGAIHASCMQSIYSGYSSGEGVAGIGLGFIQWTSHGRRLGYLEKIGELGLLKYFEGDAYKTYGRYTDDQLHEAIINETGSDADYWALWCAAIKYIYAEMKGPNATHEIPELDTAEEYGAWTASHYEVCSGCQAGEESYNARVASATEYFEKYRLGEFDSVENGSAPSAINGSSRNTGSNILIIGDSITNGSKTAIAQLLPAAEIIAQDSKRFIDDAPNNPSGLSILKDKGNNLRDIIVFALGTNDSVSDTDVKQVIEIIGPSRKIFFVTNYDIKNQDKYNANNDVLNKAAALHENVNIIDWKNTLNTASGELTDYIQDETATSNYAVNPTPAGQELFAKTISESVNGIKISNSCSLPTGELSFWFQDDEPWGSIPYGNCGDGSTIGSSGCGPTSLAMIITALTGQQITPDIIAKEAVDNGYRACGNGSYHAITELAKNYGLSVKNYGNPSISVISDHLKNGVMFHIAGSGPSPYTEGGHFIAIRGITPEGKWLIFDSAHKGSDNNTKEWDPSEIYQYTGSDWRGVSRN